LKSNERGDLRIQYIKLRGFSKSGTLRHYMFTIDLVLKYTPVPLSVQRKSEEDANALYQQVSDAMKSGVPQMLELTCDSKAEKRLTIATSELIAVQMSQKGAAADGRQPGFFVATEA